MGGGAGFAGRDGLGRFDKQDDHEEMQGERKTAAGATKRGSLSSGLVSISEGRKEKNKIGN